MNVVSSENDINCGMEFYAGNFGSTKLMHIVYVVNMVIFNDREHATHTTYNTGLFTVMNITSSYYMSANGFLCPTIVLGTAYCITLHLSRTFYMLVEEVVVIVFLGIVTEGNTATL